MNIIVAYQRKDRGIGLNGEMPWHLSEDLKYFKEKTSYSLSDSESNVLFMGRKTWESIPENHRSLKDRTCYVVSRKTDIEFKNRVESFDNTYLINNFDDIVTFVTNMNKVNVWLIGGAQLYAEMIKSFSLHKIYVTEIYTNKGEEYECDTFFPEIDTSSFLLTRVSPIKQSKCKKTGKTLHYRFLEYKSYVSVDQSDNVWKSSEIQYLEALRDIRDTGVKNVDRTGVGTLSKFGMRFEYYLKDGFPALTTKRIFLRGVFEELMMYLRGQTNNNVLKEKGINIWDGNTSREFLDTRGLSDYPEGDMGETYGFNFRHFGGDYINCIESETYNNGFDQLQYVIDLIKNDPSSRRIIINLWNPKTLHRAALPSCLCQYQFYVNSKTNELDLQIYIRSSDFFLANNWNTCTGALFVNMICNLEGINLTPGRLVVITGDTHLYLTHLDGVNENLNRIVRPQPILKIHEKKTRIEDFEWKDMDIIGYYPQKNIRAEMAV
jgi:dihydrofolate reductase / thymidylate synthase